MENKKNPDIQEIFTYVESTDGKNYIKKHIHRYKETVKLLPKIGRLSVLDLGTFIPFAIYLKKTTSHRYTYHGIWNGKKKKKIRFKRHEFMLHNFDVEKDAFPFANESFDLILCCEVIEHLGLDPMNMIAECNRILKHNGSLLLTTPNVTSLRNTFKILLGYAPYLYASFTLLHDRHNREYSPNEIHNMLAEGGFGVKKIFTKDVYYPERLKFSGLNLLLRVILTGVQLFSKLRGDCIFVLAQKISSIKNRYPSEFYDNIDHKNV